MFYCSDPIPGVSQAPVYIFYCVHLRQMLNGPEEKHEFVATVGVDGDIAVL